MVSFISKKQHVEKKSSPKGRGGSERLRRGSEIRYHANLLLQLKQEHRQLLAHYSEIEMALREGRIKPFASHLKRFREQFSQHMLMEDSRLYLYLDRMFDEPGSREKELVRRFRQEMEGLGAAIMTWLDGCLMESLDPDNIERVEEVLATIEAALSDRIRREEGQLFPLYRAGL